MHTGNVSKKHQKHMKYLLGLITCLLTLGCASTKQNKPLVEAEKREYSFDHIDGLEKDLQTLVQSPGFEMPKMIGGMDALQDVVNDLAKQTPCPVRGRVSVNYVVDEQGNVIDPQTALGIHETCDTVAEQAIAQMRFEPAKKSGESIKLQMSTPITFK